MARVRPSFLLAGAAALAALALSRRKELQDAVDTYVLDTGRIATKVGLIGPGYEIAHSYRFSSKGDPRIHRFLAQWRKDGPFPLMIPEGGGDDRTAAQVAANFAAGTSNAQTLGETAHGRRGAADLYPAVMGSSGRVLNIYLAEQPRGAAVASWLIRPDLFEILGIRAEAAGLQWGGRWVNKYGFGPYGDAPHVQVPNWRDLPLVA